VEDLERQLGSLEPELAQHIRDSASRAGLQAHDPAARMIAEMWVAVAALERERDLLSGQMQDLTQRVRENNRYLMALIAVGTVTLLAVLALLSA